MTVVDEADVAVASLEVVVVAGAWVEVVATTADVVVVVVETSTPGS